MTEYAAKEKATRLNKFVKHPSLNYRAIQIGERKYGVGQFLGDEKVGIVP